MIDVITMATDIIDYASGREEAAYVRPSVLFVMSYMLDTLALCGTPDHDWPPSTVTGEWLAAWMMLLLERVEPAEVTP